MRLISSHLISESSRHVPLTFIIIILRKPLSLHTVTFGDHYGSAVLRRMVQIALEIQNGAPADPNSSRVDSSFSEALDSVSSGLLAAGVCVWSVSDKKCRFVLRTRSLGLRSLCVSRGVRLCSCIKSLIVVVVFVV